VAGDVRKERLMTVEVAGVRYGTGGIDRRRGVLTVKDAAAYIGVSPRTLRRMLAARQIRFIKIGSLIRLYRPDLDKFLEGCEIEAA
jgi:excisionase family DNA binding protein